MMKDMKWKQIDTTYAGKAYQVEAEEINLHGEVNIQGSLSVNDSPLDTPTAAGTSYDNTASGLTGDDVQEAVDELADVRVKIRNFNKLADMATWCIANYSTIKPIVAHDDQFRAWVINVSNTDIKMYISNLSGTTLNLTSLIHNGTTTTGYSMANNNTPSAMSTSFGDNITWQLLYI